MSYETILVHCDASKTAPLRLHVATELAGRFGSRLVGCHARPPFNAPAFADDAYALAPLYEAYEERAKADLVISRTAFDKAIKGKEIKSEWRVVDGNADDELIVAARYADLLVVGQSDPDGVMATPPHLPETVAMAAGRPVLIVPRFGVAKPPGKVVMLCWNASRESARAAADALHFLQAAEKVIVLVVDPHESMLGHGAEPGADAATWLARNGVKVTVQREVALDSDVGNLILSRALDYDVDLIVMGVYGHSRMREFVLGGVTRTLLSSMTVPVLMSH